MNAQSLETWTRLLSSHLAAEDMSWGWWNDMSQRKWRGIATLRRAVGTEQRIVAAQEGIHTHTQRTVSSSPPLCLWSIGPLKRPTKNGEGC